jgi:ankyrin repeat protein
LDCLEISRERRHNRVSNLLRKVVVPKINAGFEKKTKKSCDEALKALLTPGCENWIKPFMNTANESGVTPLELAVSMDCPPKTLKLMVQYGASSVKPDRTGALMVQQLVRVASSKEKYQQQLAVFRIRPETSAGLYSRASDDGTTALHTATIRGLGWLINLLIESGSSKTQLVSKERTSSTSLYHPYSQFKIAGRFPSATASVSYKRISNRVPAGASVLHCATFFNQSCVIQDLIDHGSARFVALQDESRSTPVHYAVEHGNLEILEALFKANPDWFRLSLKIRDMNDDLPVSKAIKNGLPIVISMLLHAEHGFVDINSHEVPLMSQLSEQTYPNEKKIEIYFQMVEILVAYGARYQPPQAYQLTPFLQKSTQRFFGGEFLDAATRGLKHRNKKEGRAELIGEARIFGSTINVDCINDLIASYAGTSLHEWMEDL